jgi:hypothetical protein
MNENCPEMSVVLATSGDYETIRKTVRHLRAQTVRDRLELVIVASSREALDPDEAELQDFQQFQIVEMGVVPSVCDGYAAGVQQATAPVVAFAEDHSYPDPGWAAALIEAHRQPWAVVGPVIALADPGNATSWADYLLAYGPWLDPTPAGVVDHLPGHNSAYKRAHLMQYGPKLAARLQAESVLHRELRDQGYQLYLEPAARTLHVNFSQLSTLLPRALYSGWTFAAERARSGPWGVLRRLLFMGATPLIPLVRLRRALRDLHRTGRQGEILPRVLPPLILGLVASALGEAAGYACGDGDALQRLSEYEFHRPRRSDGTLPEPGGR